MVLCFLFLFLSSLIRRLFWLWIPPFASSTVPCQFRVLNCRAACSQGTKIKQEKFLHCCKTGTRRRLREASIKVKS